jgi:hypothetical protein
MLFSEQAATETFWNVPSQTSITSKTGSENALLSLKLSFTQYRVLKRGSMGLMPLA